MTRTRAFAHTCTAATIGLLLAASYSATFQPWLILPATSGATTTAVLAAGLYNADRRERATLLRLKRLRNTEPIHPTTLTAHERQALDLIEHHLKDAA